MSISTSSALTQRPRAASVAVQGDRLRVSLRDGREISVPVEWFDFLGKATDEQRQRFHVDEYGAAISWDELDDRVSVPALFGLPEQPPRTRRDKYVIDYRHDGRRWIAEVAELESWTWARTLSAAKRDGREMLALLLDIESLDEAGIQVIDEVRAREAVEA